MEAYFQQCAYALYYLLIAVGVVIGVFELAVVAVRVTCMTVTETVTALPGLIHSVCHWTAKAGVALFRVAISSYRSNTKQAREEEAAAEAAAPPGSAFEQAMETLGFTRDQDITRDELKQRQRLLMSTLHPDTGFPNTIFAQLVNEAVKTVKKAKGWR